jgi:hypothetical protein
MVTLRYSEEMLEELVLGLSIKHPNSSYHCDSKFFNKTNPLNRNSETNLINPNFEISKKFYLAPQGES